MLFWAKQCAQNHLPLLVVLVFHRTSQKFSESRAYQICNRSIATAQNQLGNIAHVLQKLSIYWNPRKLICLKVWVLQFICLALFIFFKIIHYCQFIFKLGSWFLFLLILITECNPTMADPLPSKALPQSISLMKCQDPQHSPICNQSELVFKEEAVITNIDTQPRHPFSNSRLRPSLSSARFFSSQTGQFQPPPHATVSRKVCQHEFS